MNAQQMLAMGGFPDTAEGRQAFYNQYPDEASFHKKMKTGGSSGLAFPQQPTAAEFYAPQYTPNSPVGFYQNGGLAYPQQPPADMFFSGHPFTPEYASGGMPCMDCGGYMDDGGQASPFGYGQMPPTIGMAYGGSAKSFSKAMKKHFDDGGTAPQGSSMEKNYNQQIKDIQAFIGGNVTNAIATEEYNKPVYDIGGESTFNMDKQDQLIAMQTGLDMSEQQRQYQKQLNLSNLINSYALGGLPKHQTNGPVSDAERMFGQAPTFGKQTSPLYFGHTQGSTAANATSGSLNPELTAKGNQLAQDIHNFNPSGAGVHFTAEQLRYLQSHGYGQQNQQQNSVWNPGYKVRAKGWENSADGTKGNAWRTKGTSDSPYPMFGPGPQGPGSFNMSQGLNAQQVADMNKYYNAHGMHMDYDQKNGFLGQLFGMGPRSIKMHLGSLNDHNQKNPAQSAQSAQSATAASSSNPSGGGFHPFEGMRKRMAERKYNRSAEGMYDADVASGLYDDGKVTGLTYRNQTTPTATDQETPEAMANRKAWEKANGFAYGGAPSVYLPHGYQQGGFNEVENDDYEDDGDYEYMTPEEIAEYIAAGGQIKYV
jgi:hypothetical protein